MEEEKIALKLKNKELKEIISNLFNNQEIPLIKALNENGDAAIEDNADGDACYKDIINENDALRKGLREILEELRAKDGIYLVFDV